MKLLSINIGKKRTQQRKDYVEETGIYKEPVNEPVEIKSLGIDQDVICDTKNHGGPDQAVYIYGGADYAIVWNVATAKAPDLVAKLKPIVTAADATRDK
mgnify:CR=1 FL=1